MTVTQRKGPGLRTILLLLLALDLLAAGFLPPWWDDDTRRRIANSGALRVGLDPAYPPFENDVQGELIGYDVDLARELGQQMGLEIDVIAPSHGVIWREAPLRIVEQYVRWSRGETRPRAVVVYETMWGSTAEIARAIVEGIAGVGAEAQLYAVPQTDHTTVVGDLLEARGIAVGSATHNRRPLLNISALVEDLIGLKPVNKIGTAFGSHGWGGGAVPVLEKGLLTMMEIVRFSVMVPPVPRRIERKRLFPDIGFSREAAQKRAGLADASDYGPQRVCWLSQLATDWMGDDGTLKKLACRIRRPNLIGDINTVKARVADKYIEDGEHLVVCDMGVVNQAGTVTAPGRAVIALPSRD